MDKPKYAVVGLNKNWEPFVVANVTTDEAKVFATSKKLPSFQIFPNRNPGQNNRGMIHYRWEEDEAKYVIGETAEWSASLSPQILAPLYREYRLRNEGAVEPK